MTKCGNISVTFVTSKSRIVPLKKSITMPQLELLENFILPNLIRSVYNWLSEEIFIEELICWTDSFILLSWIKAVYQELKLFVQNRVIKIRGSRVLLGKSRNTVDRPVNRLYPLETNFKFVLTDSEQNKVQAVMKEGTCRPKREDTELEKFRMRYAPGINWRGGSGKYSDIYLLYIIKHMRIVKIKSYWFSWKFVLKVIRRPFWTQSSEK